MVRKGVIQISDEGGFPVVGRASAKSLWQKDIWRAGGRRRTREEEKSRQVGGESPLQGSVGHCVYKPLITCLKLRGSRVFRNSKFPRFV